MSAVGPGDCVECIESSSGIGNECRPLLHGAYVEAGRIYTVVRVYDGFGLGGPLAGFELAEQDTRWTASTGEPGGWATHLFRPIYKRDESLTERLLEGINLKSKQPTKEDA